MIIFYSTNIEGTNIILTGEEHHHCSKVLRNHVGDTINITDGKGHLYQSVIRKITKTDTICEIISTETQTTAKGLPTIAISLLKNPSRLEWFVEKAVEIGVAEIILFSSSRTEKKSNNTSRIEKIMVAAMKQSLNFYLPPLTLIDTFADLLNLSNAYHGKYLAWCGKDTAPLQKCRNMDEKNILLIGPEGDFTDDEVTLAVEEGFSLVSLGSTRLRTETAGVVGLTLLHF